MGRKCIRLFKCWPRGETVTRRSAKPLCMGATPIVASNLPEKFNIEEDNFSKEKLSHLFSENKFEYIIDNIDQFKLVEDETNIILKIVEIAEYSKKDYYFNECLEKFKNLNHKEIANKFIESGCQCNYLL